MTAPDVDPLIGTLFAGRFHIQGPLSSGGMGAVYVAQQYPTGRLVALKVIKAEALLNPDFSARFARETQTLAQISHPNIVTFLDSGVDNGNAFIVMELLQGRSLRQELDSVGRMHWQRALKIGVDVCRGLAALHRRGLVHRDLKPDNIFLQASEGHEDFVKLIDLGIVRIEKPLDATQTALTQTGMSLGTPGYMSPEQLQSQPATPHSDLYALGVILYELVTGVFPFAAPDLHAMFVKQLFGDIAHTTTLTPEIPGEVDEAIADLMAREPAQRPASGDEGVRLLAPLVNAPDHTPARGHAVAVRKEDAPPAPPPALPIAPPTAPSIAPPSTQDSSGSPTLPVQALVMPLSSEVPALPSRPHPTPATAFAMSAAAVTPLQRAVARSWRPLVMGGVVVVVALGIAGVAVLRDPSTSTSTSSPPRVVPTSVAPTVAVATIPVANATPPDKTMPNVIAAPKLERLPHPRAAVPRLPVEAAPLAASTATPPVVEEGNTLAALSMLHYGDATKAEILRAANKLAEGEEPRTGTRLKVPTTTSFTVHSGDVLEKVADRYLAARGAADLLAERNGVKKDVPLKPGNVLAIFPEIEVRTAGRTAEDIATRYLNDATLANRIRAYNGVAEGAALPAKVFIPLVGVRALKAPR